MLYRKIEKYIVNHLQSNTNKILINAQKIEAKITLFNIKHVVN